MVTLAILCCSAVTSRPAAANPPTSGKTIAPMTNQIDVVPGKPGPDKPGSDKLGQTGDIAFRPVGFAALAGWADDDHSAAFKAYLRSCDRVLAAVKGGALTGKVPPSPGLLSACDEARRLGPKTLATPARLFFERNFVPHAVVHKAAEGLFTGYYEPLLEAARKPDARFRTPIHKRPHDLVNLVDESRRGAIGDAYTHARKTAAGVEPYATREAIDKGALAGQGLELFYMADPVDVFFMQIQGSGRLRLTDGQTIRVGYDGKNGHPYTSIGRYLIDHNVIGADRMSLAALGAWLKADPERGRKVMWRNASYVFFRELTGEQASGAIGVWDIPLTPGRSLAVDAGFHAIGTPVWIDAPALTHATKSTAGKVGGFHRLMIAQDVGSAIKGPERGDIYFGSGDAAGKLAGVTKHPGRFHVLLPRVPTMSASPPATVEQRTARP